MSGKGGRHGSSADSARTEQSAKQDPRSFSPLMPPMSGSCLRRDVSLQLSHLDIVPAKARFPRLI